MPRIEHYNPSRTDARLVRLILIALAVLLLAGTIQTWLVFRPQMIELSARADRQLAEASELLREARELSGEVVK